MKAVTKGQRCALAMWLTHDANYKEIARFHTQRELDKIMKKSKEIKLESGKKVESSEHTRNEDTESERYEEQLDIEVTDEMETKENIEDKSIDMGLGKIDIKIDTEIMNDPEVSKLNIDSLDKAVDVESDVEGSVVTILSKLDMDRGTKETEIKIVEDSLEDSIDESLDDSIEKSIDELEDSKAGFPSDEDDVRDEL